MRAVGAYVVWAILAAAAVAIVHRQRRRPAAWQSAALAIVAAAAIVAFALVSWGRATPLGDFNKAYYPAGSMILSDPSRLYACQVSNLCFVNLPLVALLFTPLTAIGLLPAQWLFTAIEAAAVIAAVCLTIREHDAHGADRSAIIAVFALNGPLLYSARLGNLSHVLLPLLVMAIAALATRREVRGGVLLAVLTVIKLPFLVFLPYLIVRGRLIAATALVTTLALMVAVSVALFGVDLHASWLDSFVGPFAARPVAAYNVQSISALVAHWMMPGHLTDWEPLDAPAGVNAARYALLLTVAALAGGALIARAAPREAGAQRVELYIVLVVALLASPLTWTHYYAFLTLPLAAYAAGRIPVGNRWPAAVALAAVLVSLPVVLPYLNRPLLDALIERVLISHYTWGGLLLLGSLCAARFADANRAARRQRGTRGFGATPRVDGAPAVRTR